MGSLLKKINSGILKSICGQSPTAVEGRKVMTEDANKLFDWVTITVDQKREARDVVCLLGLE